MLTILAGPARSGKTEQLLRRYRTALGRAAAGSGALVGPHVAGGSGSPWAIVRRGLRGCFRPDVMTFETFAETILHAAGPANPSPCSTDETRVDPPDHRPAVGTRPANAFPVRSPRPADWWIWCASSSAS